jgi:pilus assembly protein FimV
MGEVKPPETAMPVDSRLSQATAQGPTTTTRFEPRLPAEAAAPVAKKPAVIDPLGKTTSGIDFGALDFDLGPTRTNLEPPTVPPRLEETAPPPAPSAPPKVEAPRAVAAAPAPAAAPPPPTPKWARPEPTPAAVARAREESPEPPTIPSLDLMFPPTGPRGGAAPTAAGTTPMPQIDLNLPSTQMPEASESGFGSLEEALSRPTLLGAVGALPDEQVPRLTSNTDQATVPLIDFDLSGADATLGGRRTETPVGSPLASQMATKLDLARGYIDLGVKDGARELLEEVMKDGTREQRQQAVELIKQVEA